MKYAELYERRVDPYVQIETYCANKCENILVIGECVWKTFSYVAAFTIVVTYKGFL
jgi:hypothetical protein